MASEEIVSSRPSTHGDSTASTISPHSAKGEKSTVQPDTDLSKLDSKAVVVQDQTNQDPFLHLPENEASILRRRKCYPDS